MSGRTKPIRPAIHLGPLAEDLPFMIRNLQAFLRPHSEALRQRLGLEAGMIGILSLVGLNPGLSQNDLAASVALKKSAVTKLVKELEARQLIARQRVAEDRRWNALFLTEQGEAMLGQLRQFSKTLHSQLFKDIDPADRAIFFQVLKQLTETSQHLHTQN